MTVDEYIKEGFAFTDTSGPGTEDGEVCNHEGCKGIIVEEDTTESCSCHINPPCGYCTTDRHFCPECGWQPEKA